MLKLESVQINLKFVFEILRGVDEVVDVHEGHVVQDGEMSSVVGSPDVNADVS